MLEGAVVSIGSCEPAMGAPSMTAGATMAGANGTWSFGDMDPKTNEVCWMQL